MSDNFKTHLLNETGKLIACDIGDRFDALLTDLKDRGVDGRYLALVSTKLEEACFFAKKAIAVKAENQVRSPPPGPPGPPDPPPAPPGHRVG